MGRESLNLHLALWGMLLLLSACGGDHAPGLSTQNPTSNNQKPSDSNGGGDGSGTPPPATPVLTASFQSIHNIVLTRSCLGCHATGGRAAGVPLDTLAEVLNSPRELVIPGNFEESGLWIALTRQDAKRMPPSGTSYQTLSAEELIVIKQWILEGAKP